MYLYLLIRSGVHENRFPILRCTHQTISMADGIEKKIAYDYTGTCPICREASDNPKMLTCLHALCPSCLAKVSHDKQGNPITFRCPLCQQSYDVPTDGSHQFFDLLGLRNFLIIKLKEDTRQDGHHMTSYRQNTNRSNRFSESLEFFYFCFTSIVCTILRECQL